MKYTIKVYALDLKEDEQQARASQENIFMSLDFYGMGYGYLLCEDIKNFIKNTMVKDNEYVYLITMYSYNKKSRVKILDCVVSGKLDDESYAIKYDNAVKCLKGEIRNE